jgi:hypothetical protein
MKKLINITGFASLTLFILSFIVFLTCILWDVPLDGTLLHDLIRYSIVGGLTLSYICFFMFVYREFKD